MAHSIFDYDHDGDLDVTHYGDGHYLDHHDYSDDHGHVLHHDYSDEHDHVLHYDTMQGNDPSLYAHSPSFGSNPPNASTDGYIYQGHKVTLESQGGNHNSFDLYTKNGSKYVYEDNQWKKISGNGWVTIGHIDYHKI